MSILSRRSFFARSAPALAMIPALAARDALGSGDGPVPTDCFAVTFHDEGLTVRVQHFAPTDARAVLADRENHPTVRRSADGGVDSFHSFYGEDDDAEEIEMEYEGGAR
jgi:hypothetical protein